MHTIYYTDATKENGRNGDIRHDTPDWFQPEFGMVRDVVKLTV